MTDEIFVIYEKGVTSKVPTLWRKKFKEIVNVFKSNDLNSLNDIEGVKNLSLDAIQEIALNINDYGETLISLPDETWDTSECSYMGPCWNVIIDLFTENEGRSDLILSVKVFEKEETFEFSIQDIFVP